MMRRVFQLTLFTSVLIVGFCQEESLQSALEAIYRRQREFSNPDDEPNRYENGYPSELDEDTEGDVLAYLIPADEETLAHSRRKNLENNLIDYVEDDENDRYENDEGNSLRPFGELRKREQSAFRERLNGDSTKQSRQDVVNRLLGRLEEDGNVIDDEIDDGNDDDYEPLLQEAWQKYKSEQRDQMDGRNVDWSAVDKLERVFDRDVMNKRQYFGEYSPVAFKRAIAHRKRARYSLPEKRYLYPLNYFVSPGDEPINYDDDEDNERIVKRRRYGYDDLNNYQRYKKTGKSSDNKNYRYEALKRKRYPVTKRSSNYYAPVVSSVSSHHKRYSRDDKMKLKSVSGTDPKVVRDLSNIFGSSTDKDHAVSDKKNDKEKPHAKNITVTHSKKSDIKVRKSKEILGNAETPKEIPLQVKKKSIDWSNYFGLDRRRKKSGRAFDSNKIDYDWLKQQYYKTAQAAQQSAPNREYSPNNELTPFDTRTYNDKKRNNMNNMRNDVNLESMDKKLKSIEDSIVDDALKYTGAHEGEIDSKEVQEVKNRIMTQLATAYNLEKMRQALKEYRMDIAQQKMKMKENQNSELLNEDKRVVVKKELDIDEKHQSVNDSEQKHRAQDEAGNTGSTNHYLKLQSVEPLSEGLMGGKTRYDECPIMSHIIHRCKSVDIIAGDNDHLFLPLCSLHQVCLLCDPEDGSSSPRDADCDSMFISEAEALCEGTGDASCSRAVQTAALALRQLRSDPELVDADAEAGAGQCQRNPCIADILTNFSKNGLFSYETRTQR